MSGAKSVDAGARAAPQPKSSQVSKSEKTEKAEKPQQPKRAESKGNAVREARNKDSFEAAAPKAKVELNPSARPANSNVEVAKKEDPAKAAADSDAARRQQIDAELAKTETGRKAQQDLQRSGAEVAFEDGNRSYFDPSKNRVVVGRDQSPQDASGALVNESVHAAANADGRTPDPAKLSRDQYADAMVHEEAQSSAAEIEHRRELAAQGGPAGTATTALDRQYDQAYQGAVAGGLSAEAAKEAGRAAVLKGVQDGSAVAGVSGQKYGDYYADQYDRVASGEITAAQVNRSQAAPAKLNDPSKIGVVLNAEPANLAKAEDLEAAGVRAARLTLTAAQLQIDQYAKLPDPKAKLDPAKLTELQTRLAEYRSKGIEVTVNLPPELVNGKPEFKRTGGEYVWADDMVKLKDSTLHDVDDNTWNKYQKDHTERTTELVQALHESVDNWEVSNEPDATERIFVRGNKDPAVPGPQQYLKDADGQYMKDGNGQRVPLQAEFDPGLPPKRYGQLLNQSYEIIKANDPGRLDPIDETHTRRIGNNVLTAGLVSGDAEESLNGDQDGKVSYLEAAMKQNGGTLKFDGVSVHPYGKNDADSFNTMMNNYAKFAQENLGHPDAKIYVTEASPGPADPKLPEHHQMYVDFVNQIAPATDGNANVARTYFFWDGTFDGHTGLKQMTEAQESLQRMLGK